MTEEEQKATEAQGSVVEEQKEVETPKVASTVDHNWQQARSVMGAQAAKIQELENHILQLKVAKEEDDDSPDPDEYLTAKHVDKRTEKKVRKETEALQKKLNELENKLYVTEQNKLESETRSQYEDYDYIVENFAVPMIQKDKALADALRSSPNPYAMAYRLAKSSDEYEKEMSKQQKPNPKAEKILKNANRPVSVQAAGGSLKSQSDYFSNLSPAQVWEQSQKYARKA